MSLRWWPAFGAVMFVSLLAHAGVAQETPAEPQGIARFKSAVEVVSVNAVVRDRKGRFVKDLTRRDFTVLDAGLERPILEFRAEADGPVKIAVLFDVSGSMRLGSKAVDARQAARQVFSALRASDEAGIFAFDTRLERVRDFTSDLSTLDGALDQLLPPYGQTSLYDAVAETARALVNSGGASNGGAARLPHRSAVIVLTDGIDTRSRLTPGQVSGIASTVDVPVYVIAVMASIDDPRDVDRERTREISSALRNLSYWTGGDLFTVSAPAHASLAARQIVDELRHQYLLAFEASPTRGWRPLQVSARDHNLVVRTRAGYIGGGEHSSKAEFDK